MEAQATDTEALAAWALAVDVAASLGWAMALAMEALDMATISTHPSLEDMDSLATTEILSQEPNI